MLSAALFERWPQVCRIKIMFTKLPTNRFVSTTKKSIKFVINWIPLRIRVRSEIPNPTLKQNNPKNSRERHPPERSNRQVPPRMIRTSLRLEASQPLILTGILNGSRGRGVLWRLGWDEIKFLFASTKSNIVLVLRCFVLTSDSGGGGFGFEFLLFDYIFF